MTADQGEARGIGQVRLATRGRGSNPRLRGSTKRINTLGAEFGNRCFRTPGKTGHLVSPFPPCHLPWHHSVTVKKDARLQPKSQVVPVLPAEPQEAQCLERPGPVRTRGKTDSGLDIQILALISQAGGKRLIFFKKKKKKGKEKDQATQATWLLRCH